MGGGLEIFLCNSNTSNSVNPNSWPNSLRH